MFYSDYRSTRDFGYHILRTTSRPLNLKTSPQLRQISLASPVTMRLVASFILNQSVIIATSGPEVVGRRGVVSRLH